MARNDARTVKVTISADGEVLRVRDPILTVRPYVDAAFPKRGVVYGWNLEPRLSGRQIQQPTYASSVAAAPNASEDRSDRQTLQVQPTQFVKLDCGFWGNYKDPQRDFGIIEGTNVWLCKYTGTTNPGNDPDKLPASGTLAAMLLERLAAHGKYIHLVSHASIPPNARAAVPPDQKLYICFPDLHLPEQWPDLYPASSRLAPGRRRAGLRRLLHQCQCKVGPQNDSLLTQADLDLIQTKIDAWEGGSAETITISYAVSTSVYVPPVENAMPVFTPNRVTETFVRDEFLAEKAHLDREIQGKSAWFYRVTAAPGADVAVPPIDQNEMNPPVDSVVDDPVAGDVSPAIDLSNFLFIIRELRQSQGANKVVVVQVGDLYELWMNREFMYKQHATIPADEIGGIRRDGYAAVTAMVAINVSADYTEAFQLRMDPTWTGSSGGPHPAKRYPYHSWPQAEMLYRHDISGNPGAPALTRLQGRLIARCDSVEAWTWPGGAPADHSALIVPLRDWIRAKPAGYFQRQNRRAQMEIRWNRLILELLLVELDAKRIHGNHDGYRSDPQLMTNPGHRAACKPWFSELGVWVEHSHRWDYYNRDGVAMGAGMTNVVYYHNQELIAASGGFAAAAFRLEQAFYQAGSAQWYLLTNYGQPSTWFNPGIQKFGVYVGGHTHGPDLVKIVYDLATSDQIAQWARERQAEAEQALRDAQDWLRRQREEASRRAQEALNAIARGLRRAGDYVNELRDSAARRLRQAQEWLRSWRPW
ncbi:MAG: hypothetical protein HY717_17335 [Planctomycetes bacterium]|nr:hypothetical protein [Planctomycetota bacterium]